MRPTRRSEPRGYQMRIVGALGVLLAGVFVGVAGILAGPGAASAQSQGAAASSSAAKGSQSMIRVQTNLVTTPVTVIDRATGSFVYDLDRADFELFDNGVRQHIERFDREPHKIASVIVIQTSDAVAPLLKEVKPLAPLFSQLMLGSKGEAAVLFYSGRIRTAQDFSSSGSRLNKTLQGVAASGSGARLNDALMQAMSLLEKRPVGERRIIVVFSTGYDSGSSTAKNDVIRRAAHAEVEIYGLNLSLSKATLKRQQEPEVAQSPQALNVAGPSLPGRPSTPSSPTQNFGESADITQDLATAARLAKSVLINSDMEAYCRYTGGQFFTHWSSQALQVNLNKMATEINSQYELAYVPDNLSTLGFHRIDVKVDRHGVRVRARLGYFYFGPRQ